MPALYIGAGTIGDSQVGANWRLDVAEGLDSAQSEATGWDALVKGNLADADVVRTSSTVITITLPAFSTYNITADETITATIPFTAIKNGTAAMVATPTFLITAAAVVTQPIWLRVGGVRGMRAVQNQNFGRSW